MASIVTTVLSPDEETIAFFPPGLDVDVTGPGPCYPTSVAF